MTINITIADITAIVIAVAGLNWFILTLALAPLKQSIRRLENKNIMTFEVCTERMGTCKQIRDAEAVHETIKKHN